MNSFQIFRRSAARTCCKRSFSSSLPKRQNGQSRNTASALLEELASPPNRSLPSSSQTLNPSQSTSPSSNRPPTNWPPSSPNEPSPPNSPLSQPTLSLEHNMARELLAMQSRSRPQPQKPANFSVSEARKPVEESVERSELEQQVHRPWRRGDVYAPHDLSGVEMSKWKPRKGKPQRDVFDELGLDPRKEYKNFALLGEFMTETGRIKHSSATGLRPRNQRRVAKAIRRAIGIGIMPSVHKHPEMMARSRRR